MAGGNIWGTFPKGVLVFVGSVGPIGSASVYW